MVHRDIFPVLEKFGWKGAWSNGTVEAPCDKFVVRLDDKKSEE